MKNRMLPLALTLALVLGLAAPALASESRFADVPAGSWFEAAVTLCAHRGIMVGTGEDTFSPEATLSENECMVLALRLYDLCHGGDGVFDPAPEDWGRMTLTFEDGEVITGDINDETIWSWIAMSRVDRGHLGFRLKTEEQRVWGAGKDYQRATLTLDGADYPGSMHFLKEDHSLLGFEVDDSAMKEKIAEYSRRYTGAPSWCRDATYYLDRLRGGDVDGLSFGNLGFVDDRYTPPTDRADFAVALAVAAGELPEIRQVDGIPGIPSMDMWYAQDAYMLYRAGVLTGKDEYGSFDPESTLTRAEAACMVARVLDETKRLSEPLTPLPTGGYTLTYLRDGAADCGVTYPVCPLAGGTEAREVGGILLLDGTLLPWPGSVYSSGLEQMGEYAWFSMWDESTEDPWDSVMGLMAADGSWAVAPGSYERVELFDFAEARTIQRPYACHDGLYWDADGRPVSRQFDWCGDLSARGQGFAGLEGKIYRIEFDV